MIASTPQMTTANGVFIPQHSVKQALFYAMARDWNMIRKIAEGRDLDTFTLTLSFSRSLPMPLAVEIMEEYLRTSEYADLLRGK